MRCKADPPYSRCIGLSIDFYMRKHITPCALVYMLSLLLVLFTLVLMESFLSIGAPKKPTFVCL